MATETQYLVATYDTLAGGTFTAEGADLTWPGGTGFLITDIAGQASATGKMYFALLTGDKPTTGETITQGGVTADVTGPAPGTGDSAATLYPSYGLEDFAVTSAGATTWTGPALGVTHSFFFSGQTANVVPTEILTFSPGNQQCEVITVESDAGATGELSVRWITPLDSFEFPDNGDTFTGSVAGDGALDGVVHPRCYSVEHLHRYYADLSDNRRVATGSDDVVAVYSVTPSRRNTNQIIRLRGNTTITDEVSQHLFGGSVESASGGVLYAGLAFNVADPDGSSEPLLIQDDAIVTNYWANAYMPDSIVGPIRILVKVREDDVDIDGRRVGGRLFEYGDSYFIGATVLGPGETGLPLFSDPDGNNQTAVGTVAGAPYNSIVITEGYQQIDYNNGNGSRDYGFSFDLGSATKPQSHERLKYIQRRDTVENLFGRNAQLFTGFTVDFAYDNESGVFQEDEELAWGTTIPFTGETGGNFTVGNVLVGDTSNARARILYLDDQGTTGTMIVALEGATNFNNTEGLTEESGGAATGVTATSGTVVNNATFGTMRLYALDDNGTNGVFYGQLTRGTAPADNQEVRGATSLATADADTATSVTNRSVRNQFFGVFTGADFNPGNPGMALDTSDAGSSDLFLDLAGVQQQPPNNQNGTVLGGEAGDELAVLPWDGTSTDAAGDAEPDFDEATLDVALVAGVTTTVDVNAIPVNTPAAGFLLVERDSDGQYDLLEYVSFTGSVYTLGGSTPTAPNNAAISNNVMRAFIYKTWATTGVPESYTAVQTGTNQVVVILKQGGVDPIVPFVGTATFGATGFDSAVQRTSDA